MSLASSLCVVSLLGQLQAHRSLTEQHTQHLIQLPSMHCKSPLCFLSFQASYLRRAAADWSDLIAERSHRNQQLVVLVEDTAAGGLVQTQQALTAQHVQRET